MTNKEYQQSYESEADFENTIKELAGWNNYLYYHTHRSQFSPPGFPDCVMGRIEPTPRLIFAELKSEKGELTIEQYAWLYLLQHLGHEAYLWKPSEWEKIVSIVTGDEL